MCPTLHLSIVVPARDEAANLPRLVQEVQQGVRDAGVEAELIVVDDGSTDDTKAVLERLESDHTWVKPVVLPHRCGQSGALAVGVRRAAAPFVATLDADLQNDPADLPAMLRLLVERRVDLVQGQRVDRRDPWPKRVAGRVGHAARRLVLHDPVRDTGCSTRVARLDLARRWPLHLDGMHRFLPVCSIMLGATLLEVPVNHRPRRCGTSHYGSLRRGAVGLIDLLAVRWMMSRHIALPPPGPVVPVPPLGACVVAPELPEYVRRKEARPAPPQPTQNAQASFPAP